MIRTRKPLEPANYHKQCVRDIWPDAWCSSHGKRTIRYTIMAERFGLCDRKELSAEMQTEKEAWEDAAKRLFTLQSLGMRSG